MPKIETRVIALQTRTGRRNQTSVGTSHINAFKRSQALETRERHTTTHFGGVTRCSRCPPRHCCEDCARINNARQIAGLIRPPGDPRPSPDNIINPTVVGKYRGPGYHRRYKDTSQPVVTAFVEKLGRGWRRGVATLNGKRVYVGKPMQSHDAAWEWAGNSAKLIKLGLRFESDLEDRYGE